MRHRFIIHFISHTLLFVDITQIGLPNEIYPTSGKKELVPSLRFKGWEDAKHYLLASGADLELVEKTFHQIEQQGVAVMTIV